MIIKAMDWPAESPYLMPIEQLWHELKEHLRSKTKRKNLQHLKDGIQEFWYRKATKEDCRHYINQNQSVMKAVIESDGNATLFWLCLFVKLSPAYPTINNDRIVVVRFNRTD